MCYAAGYTNATPRAVQTNIYDPLYNSTSWSSDYFWHIKTTVTEGMIKVRSWNNLKFTKTGYKSFTIITGFESYNGMF